MRGISANPMRYMTACEGSEEVTMSHELLFSEKQTVYGAYLAFCGDDVVE